MATDIRVDTTFKNNRKKRKLFSRLGSDGVLCLIYLWLSVAENKPEGVLFGYSSEDIELDSDWDGEPGLFVKTLLECNLLDCDENNTYSLHNWSTRQQWVYKSYDRSDKARFSILAKKYPSIYLELKEKGINAISKDEYARLTTVKRTVNEPLTDTTTKNNEPLTPSPSPSPSPNTNKKEIPDSDESGIFYSTKKNRKLSGKRLETFNQFWEIFNLKKGKADAADSWLDIPTLTDALVCDILEAAKTEAQNRQLLIDGGSSPKWAQGWLTSRRWEDEITEDHPEQQQYPTYTGDQELC